MIEEVETRSLGAAGLGEVVCLAANGPESSRTERSPQAESTVVNFRRAAPPLGPRRRFKVHISASDYRGPFGRSSAFNFRQSDLNELIAAAARFEGL